LIWARCDWLERHQVGRAAPVGRSSTPTCRGGQAALTSTEHALEFDSLSKFETLSAQRTAVQLRPHQQTETLHGAMTEPVVIHHGREVGGAGHDDVRPTAATACWAAIPIVGTRLARTRREQPPKHAPWPSGGASEIAERGARHGSRCSRRRSTQWRRQWKLLTPSSTTNRRLRAQGSCDVLDGRRKPTK
jgi:hypothetical protein